MAAADVERHHVTVGIDCASEIKFRDEPLAVVHRQPEKFQPVEPIAPVEQKEWLAFVGLPKDRRVDEPMRLDGLGKFPQFDVSQQRELSAAGWIGSTSRQLLAGLECFMVGLLWVGDRLAAREGTS